jgi:hypothetical protein
MGIACLREGTMNKLMLAVILFLMVPALRAQQAETKETPPQAPPLAASQTASQNANEADSLPEDIRPGHPLDPADVDILTGKRDRQIEASRRAAVPISVGMYGNYGNLHAAQGRFGTRAYDGPLLPLTRIGNANFFFSMMPPRGFGRGRLRGGR